MNTGRQNDRRKNLFNIATANARSVELKLDSLFDMIYNYDLNAVLLTETWIKIDKNFERIKEEIRMNRGLDIICYNRPGKRNGGGVAIVFDPSKIKLTEHRFARHGIEMVAAKGKIIGDSRSIYLYSIYLPPNLTKKRVQHAREIVSEEIAKNKIESEGPLILLGGDFNQFGLEGFLSLIHI